MKYSQFVLLILVIAISGCGAVPEIKLTKGQAVTQLLSERVILAKEETPVDFSLAAPLSNSSGSSLFNGPQSKTVQAQTIDPNAPVFGTLKCEKALSEANEISKCRYIPRKYFFGEDHAIIPTINSKGKEAIQPILFKVANTYSKPVAYPESYIAKEGSSSIDFILPEAFEPDYPQEKDNGLDYGDFKIDVKLGTLKCVRRKCTYTLKQNLTGTQVLTFTYRAIEKLRGETESDTQIISLTFKIIPPPPVILPTTPPAITDIQINQMNFSKEVAIPFRTLASNESLEISNPPIYGDIITTGLLKTYKLKKFDFVIVDDSFSYRIKRTDDGKDIYSDIKKVTIHIGAPKNPTLNSKLITFDPKVDSNFKGGVYSLYPSFKLLSKFDYEINLPYKLKYESSLQSQGTFSCPETGDPCTYILKSTPSIDGEDKIKFWLESGDSSSQIKMSEFGELRVKYYKPSAIEVDDIVIDKQKYTPTFDKIDLKKSMRGVDDYSKIMIKFPIDVSARLTCATLICTINPLILDQNTPKKQEVITFEVHFNPGNGVLITTRTITIQFYAPKGPTGNPNNSVVLTVPSGKKFLSQALILTGNDSDSAANNVVYSAFVANGDSANKIQISNCTKNSFSRKCDVTVKDGYVIQPNDSASFTYYLEDETKLKSPTQTVTISLSPAPPSFPGAGSEGYAFTCYASLGSFICAGTLPVPSNTSEIGTYTYQIKQQSTIGTAVINGTQVTITLNASEGSQFAKTVEFKYDAVTALGVHSAVQTGAAFYKFKTPDTNLAPILGDNDFILSPNATTETRTINVTDADSFNKDLQIYFNGDKNKREIQLTSTAGDLLNVKCNLPNPTQCKFTLVNPPLKMTEATFSTEIQVKDIFMENNVDMGKSSLKKPLTVKLTRDLFSIEAKDTVCTFVINSTSANCDINGLAIYESLSKDVVATVDGITGENVICKFNDTNTKINCSLTLAKDINLYPRTYSFVGNLKIKNTSNDTLSMKTAKKMTFNFSRDPKVYSVSQEFSTSSSSKVPGVDILWVVDNTFTMGPYQAALADNFQSFINTFVPVKNGVREAPFEFKMGAITTDGYTKKEAVPEDLCAFMKCSLNGNSFVVNKDLALADFSKFKQNFQSIINVGTTGVSIERSLESLQTFVDKNTSWSASKNLLVLIFISDELEQSNETIDCPLPESKNRLELGANAPSPFSAACKTKRIQDSIDQIKKMKERMDLIKVFSIIDPLEDHGKVYDGISKEFQGSSQSLGSSFATLLSQIGTSITDTFLEYTLTYQGTFKAIKSVKINGVNQEFDYLGANKIKLKTAPGEGKTLVVEFEYTNND
jgi:hypothetical protein